MSNTKISNEIPIHRESPDITVFGPPRNCTIVKTVLIGDWFSYKSSIWSLLDCQRPFILLIFTRIFLIQQSLTVTLSQIMLFLQLHCFELGPNKLSEAIFFFFSPVPLFCYTQLHYFFLFPPQWSCFIFLHTWCPKYESSRGKILKWKNTQEPQDERSSRFSRFLRFSRFSRSSRGRTCLKRSQLGTYWLLSRRWVARTFTVWRTHSRTFIIVSHAIATPHLNFW